MWSRIARLALIAGLGVALVFAPSRSAPVHALGQDACPEPNDSFQAACYLGPGAGALGFISSPGDVDAYRIEVLDFSTDVHVEISQLPAAYAIEVADWNGDIFATSATAPDGAEVVETTVPIPGAYYIFVHSRGGGYSDSAPYLISRSLTYPGAKIPDILFSDEIREGSTEATEGDTEFATHTARGGKYTIAMKIPGAPQNASQAWWTGFGPMLTDFTLTVDARVTNGANAGPQVFFRHHDNRNTYYVTVDTQDGQVGLSKQVDGTPTSGGWVPTSAVNTGSGVNRIVIRCFEDDILVNVNGEDVFHVTDSSLRDGRIGIGGITWGDPAIVSFDNLIITTPTEG